MVSKTFVISRAIGVIGATAILATGVTFAALTSSVATLSDNTISSSTASLKLWNGSTFALIAPGFHVTGLVPGTGSAALPFYFQNDGGVPLNVSAHVPSAPSSNGFSGWENLKVTITSDTAPESPTITNMQALLGGNVTLLGGSLPAGATGNSNAPGTAGNYTVKFDVTPGSVTGSQVNVDSFNIDFTGVQPS